LGLSGDFAGHGAIEGVPVLVRNMDQLVASGEESKKGDQGRGKDEL